MTPVERLPSCQSDECIREHDLRRKEIADFMRADFQYCKVPAIGKYSITTQIQHYKRDARWCAVRYSIPKPLLPIDLRVHLSKGEIYLEKCRKNGDSWKWIE